MSERRRVVEWTPAFDRRHPDPSKNYGIHGVTLRFVLADDEGAVQFVLFTGWQLPHVEAEFETRPCSRLFGKCSCSTLHKPMAADLGYHSKVPHYEGQRSMTGECEWTGGTCFYDGSGLNAEPVFARFVTEGEAALWEELESFYDDELRPAEVVA